MGKGPSIGKSAFQGAEGLAGAFGNLGKSFAGMAEGPINTATNWYRSLLGGGQAARNVVAPAAMEIGNVYRGAKNAAQNFLPAGGERNLALAGLSNDRARSVADLYANVQPMAAQGLASLGFGAGELGSSFAGQGNSGYGQLENYQGQRNQAKGSALGGIGSGLGSIVGMGIAPGGIFRRG